MRWQQPSERTQLILASPLLVVLSPAFLAVAAFVAAVIVATKGKRWLMGPSTEWRAWFAWFPVRAGRWPDEGPWMWLERVERRVVGSGADANVEIRKVEG